MRILIFVALITIACSCEAMSPTPATPRPAENSNGDILLSREDRSYRVSPINEKWPNGTVTYFINDSLVFMQEDIEEAMDYIMERTCIQFVKEDFENARLRIYKYQWCTSSTGMFGEEVFKHYRLYNTMTFNDDCTSSGVIFHFLLQNLGFLPEHIRSDRDDYITIYWDNIAEGVEGVFRKVDPENNILINEFDFDSIMMFGETTASKDGVSPTLKANEEGVKIPNFEDKKYPSESDIYRINTIYEC